LRTLRASGFRVRSAGGSSFGSLGGFRVLLTSICPAGCCGSSILHRGIRALTPLKCPFSASVHQVCSFAPKPTVLLPLTFY
jgi:hypothetical protein